jgi:uncharacterized oxidoreductase
VIIQSENLIRLVARTFVKAGCGEAEAERVARRLTSANLTGHDSHGVLRVPRYVWWMEHGDLAPGQRLSIISENDTMAVVDGQQGFGQSVGEEAVQLGIDKAKQSGLSIIALRNSGHLGRIGDWAEMAIDEGLISIHFVNVAGSVLVAPFGGIDARMATNPVTIGVPMGDKPPLLLDFATSIVAEGKVMVAAKGGKPLPEGALINKHGELTTDPVALYGAHDAAAGTGRDGGGAIRAMGDHKGSGLAFMCEMLAGALTGGGCANVETQYFRNGMLSIYLKPSQFGDQNAFVQDALNYVEYFKSAKPVKGVDEVLVPGEPEQRRRADRLANGIEIADDGWLSIVDCARQVGVSDDDIAAATA